MKDLPEKLWVRWHPEHGYNWRTVDSNPVPMPNTGWEWKELRVVFDEAQPSAPVGVEGLRRMVEKLAAHVRPTCCELWEEAQAVLAQQPAAIGEEIMVNAAHDVYTLPLQPSGLSSGPRFVVHVPGPEQPAAVDEGARLDAERMDAIKRLRLAVTPVEGGGWDVSVFGAEDCKETLLGSGADVRSAIDEAVTLAAQQGGES